MKKYKFSATEHRNVVVIELEDSLLIRVNQGAITQYYMVSKPETVEGQTVEVDNRNSIEKIFTEVDKAILSQAAIVDNHSLWFLRDNNETSQQD